MAVDVAVQLGLPVEGIYAGLPDDSAPDTPVMSTVVVASTNWTLWIVVLILIILFIIILLIAFCCAIRYQKATSPKAYDVEVSSLID